jgi:hypothetical protein
VLFSKLDKIRQSSRSRPSSVGRACDCSRRESNHNVTGSIPVVEISFAIVAVVRRKNKQCKRFWPRNAGLAQSVERQALNLMVEGSSPSVGDSFTTYFYFSLVWCYTVPCFLDPHSSVCGDFNYMFLTLFI